MRMSDFQGQRSAIVEAVRASDVWAAVEEHLGQSALLGLAAMLGRLENAELVVAAIGEQGVGKSSLVNALVGRRVLPVDEMETTNVVCRLRALDDGGERAEARFGDGHVERGPVNDQWLRQFCDEQENPGNERGVDEIACFVSSPLLASGVSLVDTPGVGSTTSTTEATTMAFLPKISLGIFLVHTAPTLRHSESLFLRTTWKYSRSFVFVQNAWAGTEVAIEEALEDNQRKLDEIAWAEGSEEPVTLLAVDVHRALEGVCNDQPEDLRASGLLRLREILAGRLSSGAGRMLVAIEGRAVAEKLRQARAGAVTRAADLASAMRLSDEEFESRRGAAEDRLGELRTEWAERERAFGSAWRERFRAFERDLDTGIGKAESNTIELIEHRKMKAEKIVEAFEQRLGLEVIGVTHELERDFGRLVADLIDDAVSLGRNVGEVSRQVVRVEGAAADVKTEELFEGVGGFLEKAGGTALSAMGGTAIFAGGAALIAGEGIAAALAAAAGAVPVVGWVVAGAVLVGGLALRAYLGERAAKKLSQAVRDACATAKTTVRDRTWEVVEAQAARVVEGLGSELEAELEQERKVLRALAADRRKSAEERQETLGRLEAQVRAIDGALERVQATVMRSEETP